MTLLDPKLRQAVVAIGRQSVNPTSSGDTMTTFATGFLYTTSDSKDKIPNYYNRVWLVTCKHVVDIARDKEFGNILVRFNREYIGGRYVYPISLQNCENSKWFMHPKRDIAIIQFPWQFFEHEKLNWRTFASHYNTLTRSDAIEVGISEGDEVFILGFPSGWREGRQDYPIVRQGVLAQIQGWLNCEHSTFLVDGSGFPGNSGGPIITKPQNHFVLGTQSIDKNYLIGIVSARPRVNPIKATGISSKNEHFDIAIPENPDLIKIIPVEAIDETVELALNSL